MRNPYAKALANPCFRKRAIKAKKGKGSYNRNRNRKHNQESQLLKKGMTCINTLD
jgi:stalled ribosome alternative rescue factor ArfA